MVKNYLLTLLLYLMAGQLVAQETGYKIPDSLRKKDFDYLFEQIDSENTTEANRELYMRWFLKKARAERNWEEIVNGYKNYVHFAPEESQLAYADSMVLAARQSRNKALIGSAYLSKGIAYYGRKQNKEALDNYLIAHEYISKTNDQYLIYKTKYNLANVKYYLGFYNEAIALFRECIAYFKKENAGGYLNSLHALGLCYNRSGDYGMCSEINEVGLTEGKRLGNLEMEPYFIHSEGVNQYGFKNYNKAIEKINTALPGVQKNNDFANETVGYFYIGKSYWALGKPEVAMPYLLKIDQSFREKEYMRPDLREGYELIIRYYKNSGDLKSQLHYIERLLQADKKLDSTFKYLSGKIHKEYDTKELVQDKKKIENALQKRKYNDFIFISIIVILCLLFIFITLRYLKSRSRYRNKYEELLEKLKSVPQAKDTSPSSNGGLTINKDVVSNVLQQLNKLENSRKFLEKDLNLAKLAAYTGTNTTYLSQIILHYKGKKFSDYLNDLKVDHIAEQIRKNKALQNYTNMALAEEAGFSTTARFAHAFFARTGITPGYFIAELKKDESEVKI